MTRLSAIEVSRLLGLPHPPTPEQVAVIEAPLEPLLVVAGAGSGKTETMAARVVYLIANGLVQPDQVLGLTFTRKAAGQLSHRIRQRLARLRTALQLDDASEPVVLTYHAFGGQLLRDYGALVGVEPNARVLSPTSSWQLASSVVRRWDADLDVDLAPPLVTERLLQLAGVLADHLQNPQALQAETADLARRIASAPPGPRQQKAIHSSLTAVHARLTTRSGVLPLVDAYAEAKRRTRTIDYGDQMQLAARLVGEHPRVGRMLREQYRVVLLDEYQDTGHAQRVVLRGLFGVGSGSRGHPVTAVGDPCQSIYGWRGASASNLPRFTEDFPDSRGGRSAQLSLLTSFRNAREVLTLANAASQRLRVGRVPVAELVPAAGAPDGEVRHALLPTVDDEDDWVADQVAAAWQEHASAPPTGAADPADEAAETFSAAVLVRRRSSIPGIADRLTRRGIPVEIPGLAGLLSEPEIVDLLAVMRMLVDPAAGPAALRVLTGPRWNVGLADVAALNARARELTPAPTSSSAGGSRAVVADALARAVVENIDAASLLDALADPGPAAAYSAAGFERIQRLGAELGMLRRRLSLPLTDLVVEIEHVLGLDIEAFLAGGRARANLDAFVEVVADFVDAGGGRSVPSDTDGRVHTRNLQVPDLLAFLDVAMQREEGLERGEVEQRDDAVQILTVHAAKGLEWDLVAVPHLSAEVFPSQRGGTWLTDDGFLPPHLRGDAADLPAFDVPPGSDQKELGERVAAHKEDWKRVAEEEERRLLYVALTRARHTVLLSGHWWSRTAMSKPRGPSVFLQELAPLCSRPADHWSSPPEPGTPNPLAAVVASAPWPLDPLGTRRAAVDEGAQLVRLAQHFQSDGPPVPDHREWQRDAAALIEERRRAREPVPLSAVPLPETVSVSLLVALARDREQVTQQLRRPVPREPAPAARRGTRFHAWLEHHYAGDALLDVDELPGADDRDALPDDRLEELTRAFLSSAWADRVPQEVEVPFSTVLAGRPMRGRIDAVFADPDGGWTVVDWKTGRAPHGDELDALAVQLAVYRHAWAALSGVPAASVRAAFHFVAANRTIAPDHLPTEAELARLFAPTG